MLNPVLQTDWVVVGSGISAFTCAMTLLDAGKQVIVLSSGTGSTGLSDGRIDFGSVGENFPVFSESTHFWAHEKRYLDLNESCYSQTSFLDTRQFLEKCLGDEIAFFDSQQWLPDHEGGWRPSFGCHSMHASATHGLLSGRTVGVANILNARSVWGLCTDFWSRPKIDYQWLNIDLGLEGDAELSGLSHKLEEQAFLLETLASRINKSSEGLDFILLPALFHKTDAFRRFEKLLHKPCAQVINFHQALSGWCLSDAMRSKFESRGVACYEVENVSPELGEGSLVAINAHWLPSRESLSIRSRGVVLATGNFVGGGLKDVNGSRSDSVFGLPARRLFPVRNHCLRVDEFFRPIDENGNIYYENLLACGGVISGKESMHRGWSALTGRVCGKIATTAAL